MDLKKLPTTKIDRIFEFNGSDYQVEYMWAGATLTTFINVINERGFVQYRFEAKFEALDSKNPNMDESLSKGLAEFLMENLIQGYGK
jgi:hypothetical protein